MEPHELPAADRDRIGAMLSAATIDPSYVAFVVHHVDRPDAEWRWCCGSRCDPCVERLGRVVDAARAWLGSGGHRPPGLPGAGEAK